MQDKRKASTKHIKNKSSNRNDKGSNNLWYEAAEKNKVTKKNYSQMMHKIKLYTVLFTGIGIIIYFVIAFLAGIIKVAGIIASSKLYIYIFAFAAVFAGYSLRYIKWSYSLKKLGIKIPFKTNFKVYLSLYSMDLTPGRIGRVIMAYTLNKITKVRIAKLLPVIMMDMFTDFLGVAILAIFSAIYFDKYVVYIIVAEIIILAPFAFVLNSWLYKMLKNVLKKNRFLRVFSIYGDEYFLSQTKLNNLKVYLVSASVSAAAIFMNAMALYTVLLSIGFATPVQGDVFIYSTSQIFGMVSAVPGNLGVMDGLLVAMTSSVYHLSFAVGSAVTIMTRMATLWFGIFIGIVFFLISLKYWKSEKENNK